MNNRYFNLRLSCTYQDKENTVDQLLVEVLNDGRWEELDLSVRSPGFLLFINGLFSCQHLYMRVNSAECGIRLASAEGELKVTTGEFWDITSAEVSFNAKIISGNPTAKDMEYILERMKHCPVSTNLPHLDIKNDVTFVP